MGAIEAGGSVVRAHPELLINPLQSLLFLSLLLCHSLLSNISRVHIKLAHHTEENEERSSSNGFWAPDRKSPKSSSPMTPAPPPDPIPTHPHLLPYPHSPLLSPGSKIVLPKVPNPLPLVRSSASIFLSEVTGTAAIRENFPH